MKKAIVLATALLMAFIFAGQVYAVEVEWWFLQRRTTKKEVFWRLQFELDGLEDPVSSSVETVRLIGPSPDYPTIRTFEYGGGAGYNWSFGHSSTSFAGYDAHVSMFPARDSMYTYEVDGDGDLIEDIYDHWMITIDDLNLPEPSPGSDDEYRIDVELQDGSTITSYAFSWYGETDLPIVDRIESKCDKDGNLWISWDPPRWVAWAAKDTRGYGEPSERYGTPTNVTVEINYDWEGDPNTDPIVSSSEIWASGIAMHTGLFLIPYPILELLIEKDEDGKARGRIITRTNDNNNRGYGRYTNVELGMCEKGGGK